MDRRFDPRSLVTPYAFAVHPDLLGRPLATPWQRLGAILVDLVVIFFISQIGAAPLAIGSTALLFWLASRRSARDAFGKLFRITVGCLGFIVLSITILVLLWMQYGDEFQRALEESDSGIRTEAMEGLAGEEGAGEAGDEAQEGDLGIIGLVRGVRDVMDLSRAETREEAQGLMSQIARSSYEAGLERNEIRELIGGLLPQDTEWADQTVEMLDEAMGLLPAEDPQAGEDLIPGQPREGEVSQETGEIAGGYQLPLSPQASDSIARLNRAVAEAQEEREDLRRSLTQTQEELEAERAQGFLGWLMGIIDDLGIGFGWAALYLTITHAWWRGTSIGKKLFRIRVVMIDKRPLNWWLSFERAGGYAAGFATGLLGFAQVFWDPNRQAIHDKVSETIVIQDGKDPIPGPWMEEGKAEWRRGRHGPENAVADKTRV
jgi:hypothetical protein